MASRSIDKLSKETAAKARQIETFCAVRGVTLLIYCTLRTLQEQAKLFRQSRTTAQIQEQTDWYLRHGFDYLADILQNVGPQYGPHVTNAAPGESWHNYAMAFDAVPLIGGKAAWSYDDFKELWDIYGEGIRANGMYWAGDWKGFREFPHAQLRPEHNPLKVFTAHEIKTMLLTNNLL